MDILLIAFLLIACFYMAWNIGANDLANAMGTSVGSKALTIRQVIIIAGVFEFAGAVLFGGRVTDKIATGIVPLGPVIESNLDTVAVGMLAAILAAGFWVTLATIKNLPVSTSHSIVGAILGFGLVCAYDKVILLSDIHWGVLVSIIASWLLSPLLGGIVAYILFWIIRKKFFSNATETQVAATEKKFIILQIVTACFVAFSHGSNDVANAVAPLSAVLNMYEEFSFPVVSVSFGVLIIGAAGMVLGLAMWGHKVIETIGSQITELTPTRGFSAQFSTAAVVLLCSYIALPISTTHVLVGSVIGVGLAGGLTSVNLKVVKNIVSSWITTVPVSAMTSMFIFIGLSFIFL